MEAQAIELGPVLVIVFGIIQALCALLIGLLGWLAANLWGKVQQLDKAQNALALKVATDHPTHEALRSILDDVIRPIRESVGRIERTLERQSHE